MHKDNEVVYDFVIIYDPKKLKSGVDFSHNFKGKNINTFLFKIASFPSKYVATGRDQKNVKWLLVEKEASGRT